MDIHITTDVRSGRLRSAIVDQILNAEHSLVEKLEFASFTIGYPDSDFGPTEPESRIIIKDWREGNIVSFSGQHLLHPGTMKIIPGNKTLGEWLQIIPDPLSLVM